MTRCCGYSGRELLVLLDNRRGGCGLFDDDAVNVVKDAGVEEDAGVGAALGERDTAIVAANPADNARKNDGGELVFMLMNE